MKVSRHSESLVSAFIRHAAGDVAEGGGLNLQAGVREFEPPTLLERLPG